MTLARDLGDGPHRPWGSALSDKAGHRIPALPPIATRVRKLNRTACAVCGERNFYCQCPEAA